MQHDGADSHNVGSVTGPRHRMLHEDSQDAFAQQWWITPNGESVWVGAVADGAGSLSMSSIGAQQAVATVVRTVETLCQHVDNDDRPVQGWARKSLDAARIQARSDVRSTQIGATLAVAVVGAGRLSVSVLGDAMSVISRVSHNGGFNHTLVRPQKRSEFDNVTSLLTSDDERVEIIDYDAEISADICAISLGSDGMDEISLQRTSDGTVPFSRFWDGLVTQSREETIDISALLKSAWDAGRLFDDTTLLTHVIQQPHQDGNTA